MDTFNIIKQVIDKYNESCMQQANLASPAARADLTTLIHNALHQASVETETYNEQQMYLFEVNDQEEPK